MREVKRLAGIHISLLTQVSRHYAQDFSPKGQPDFPTQPLELRSEGDLNIYIDSQHVYAILHTPGLFGKKEVCSLWRIRRQNKA